MIKFRLGDKVKIVGANVYENDSRIGEVATISNDWYDGNYSLSPSQGETSGVTFNYKSLERYKNTMNNLEVGDVIVDGDRNYDRKVIGLVTDSLANEFVVTEDMDSTHEIGVYTVDELIEDDWGIEGEVTEVTLQQVADNMGIDVSKLRIKGGE